MTSAELLSELKALHERIPYLTSQVAIQTNLYRSRSRHFSRLRLLALYDLPQHLLDAKELVYKIDQISDSVKKDNKSKKSIMDGLLKEYHEQQSRLTDLLWAWDSHFNAIQSSSKVDHSDDLLFSISSTSAHAIRTFISTVISSDSLLSTAKALMSRQGPALLDLPARLRPFFILLIESRGPLICATFLEGMLTAGIEELEALETANTQISRQRELETVIIGLMEAAEGLKVEISVKCGISSAGFEPVRGAFVTGLEVEQVLLELLEDGRRIRSWVKINQAAQTAADEDKQSNASSEGTSFWQETGSTILGISSTILSTPVNLLQSTIMQKSPSLSLPSHERQTSKEVKSRYDLLITRSAAALITNLTSTQPESRIPLPLYLIRRLLSKKFTADDRPIAHRRALLLLIVRYYGFTYLSYFLSRLGCGDILNGVHISQDDSTDLILPLHRRAYMALIDATGFSAEGVENRFVKELLQESAGEKQAAFVNNLRALRVAARALLGSFSRPVEAAEEISNASERSFALHKSTLFQLGEDILPALPAVSSSSPAHLTPLTLRTPSTPQMSFKRSGSTESIPQTPLKPDCEAASINGLHQEIFMAFSEIKSLKKAENDDSDWALLFVDSKSLSVSVTSKPSLPQDDIVPSAPLSKSEDDLFKHSAAGSSSTKESSNAQGSSILGWSRNKTKPSISLPIKPQGGLTETESHLFRRAVKVAVMSSALLSDDTLDSLLSRSKESALKGRDYSQFALLAQACQTLASFAKDRPQLLSEGGLAVIRSLVTPLQTQQVQVSANLHSLDNALAMIRAATSELLHPARSYLQQSYNLHLRVYFLQNVQTSNVIQEVQDACDPTRSDEDKQASFSAYNKWSDANVVQEFLQCQSIYDKECQFLSVTMLIDKFANQLADTEALSLFFKRETPQLQAFAATLAKVQASTSLSSSPNPMAFLASSSQFLTNGIGQLLPKSIEVATANQTLEKPYIFLSCGAVPLSLALPNESRSSPLGAIDEWTLQIHLEMASYLFSLLHGSGLVNSDALGADSWFDSHPHSKKATLPAVVPLTTTLLGRFSLHPNPLVKMSALFNLEQILAAALMNGNAIGKVDTEKGSDHFQRMSSSLNRRVSGLSGETGPTSPIRRGRQSAAQSDGQITPSLHPFLEAGDHFPLQALPVIQPPSTDALLNTLEPLLLQIRPPHLFASLQVVSCLVPAAILDTRDEAKSYWDVALAALSIKAELVKEMVNTALTILPSGLLEQREAARNLLQIAAREGNEQAQKYLPSLQ